MAISKYALASGKTRYRAMLWRDGRLLKTKSFPRKVDADEWLKREELRRLDNKVGRLKGSNMSYEEFFRSVYLPRAVVGAGTLKDYKSLHEKYVLPAVGKKRICDIDVDQWSEMLAGLLKKNLSPARANRLHTAVSAVYSLGMDLKYVAFNPMRSVPWNTEEISDFDYWKMEEATKFLSFAFLSALPLKELYQTAYETGMRLSELIALKRDCVDFATQTISVRRSHCAVEKKVRETTKGKRKRVLGMNPGLSEVLRNLLDSHQSEFVFCDSSGRHLLPDFIMHSFERDIARSGGRRITFHCLRHTFASHYVMNGGNIYDLKELLGHANITTTMRYAHLAPDYLKSKAAIVSFHLPEKICHNATNLAQAYLKHGAGQEQTIGKLILLPNVRKPF